MEYALILVNINENKIENTKDKSNKKNYNYKILMLNNPGNRESKVA